MTLSRTIFEVDPIQLNRTAGRQARKTFLDLSNDVGAVASEQRPEPQVETEPAVRAADEVEHGQAVFALCAPQAATELLQED